MKKTNNTLWIAVAVVAVLVVGWWVMQNDASPEQQVVPIPEPAPAEDVDVIELPDDDQEKEQLLDEIKVSVKETEGCVDTDGGLNYDVQGSVVSGDITEEDICSGNEILAGRLYEEYCDDDGDHARMEYDCPSGVCMNGACA